MAPPNGIADANTDLAARHSSDAEKVEEARIELRRVAKVLASGPVQSVGLTREGAILTHAPKRDDIFLSLYARQLETFIEGKSALIQYERDDAAAAIQAAREAAVRVLRRKFESIDDVAILPINLRPLVGAYGNRAVFETETDGPIEIPSGLSFVDVETWLRIRNELHGFVVGLEGVGAWGSFHAIEVFCTSRLTPFERAENLTYHFSERLKGFAAGVLDLRVLVRLIEGGSVTNDEHARILRLRADAVVQNDPSDDMRISVARRFWVSLEREEANAARAALAAPPPEAA